MARRSVEKEAQMPDPEVPDQRPPVSLGFVCRAKVTCRLRDGFSASLESQSFRVVAGLLWAEGFIFCFERYPKAG